MNPKESGISASFEEQFTTREKFGKRDHTTVIHAYEKISHEITKNQSLNQNIITIKDGVYKNV